MALYSEADFTDEGARVEAGFPIPGPLEGNERVKIYQLPAVKHMACIVHHGSINTLGPVYQDVLIWIQANDCCTAGPAREVYLHYQSGGDPDQTIMEVQIPVKNIRKEISMKAPEIVTLDPFLLVGLHYLGKNEHQEITQLWQALMPRFKEIPHVAPGLHCSYGVCFPNPERLLDYYGGLPVTELGELPDGMVGKEVPSQTYGVFECHTIEDIGPTYHAIMQEWMPASGYQPADGPDFEYYTEAFDPGDPNSIFHIYFR